MTLGRGILWYRARNSIHVLGDAENAMKGVDRPERS